MKLLLVFVAVFGAAVAWPDDDLTWDSMRPLVHDGDLEKNPHLKNFWDIKEDEEKRKEFDKYDEHRSQVLGYIQGYANELSAKMYKDLEAVLTTHHVGPLTEKIREHLHLPTSYSAKARAAVLLAVGKDFLNKESNELPKAEPKVNELRKITEDQLTSKAADIGNYLEDRAKVLTSRPETP